VMATEARETPLPRLTPPPSTTPAAGHAAAGGSNPGGVSAFGPTVGVGTTPPTTAETPETHNEPKQKSKLPLILGGVAVAGIGAVIALKVAGGGAQPKTPDATLVIVPDAAAPADTQVAGVLDAPPVEPLPAFTREMIKVAGGDFDIGEDKPGSPTALKKTHVVVSDFWLDKDEITLEVVRKALTSPKLGGLPTDAPNLPARNVTWGQAVATCKALGKRLPTEAEWEIAAQTTPKDAAKAALMKLAGKPALVASKHEDCSAVGLCDMLGGVIEWTADGTKDKVVRGASFTVSPTAGWQASIHFRTAVPPTADAEVGFRCAWSKEPTRETTGDTTSPPVAPPVAPAPQVAQRPPEPAKPVVNCDDVDGQYQEVRRLLSGGAFAATIAKAEAAIACRPENRGYVFVALAACKMNNGAKANAAAAKITGAGQRGLVAQSCATAGVPIAGFQPLDDLRDLRDPRGPRGGRRGNKR